MRAASIGLALIAAACAGVPEPIRPTPISAAALEGVIWRAAGSNEETAPLLRIVGDKADGFGGCNRWGAFASIEGELISFGPVAATKRACAATLMTMETYFFEVLGRTRSARLVGEALTLLDGEGQALLVLNRTTPPDRP